MTYVEMLDGLLELTIKEQTLDNNSEEFNSLYDHLMSVLLALDQAADKNDQ